MSTPETQARIRGERCSTRARKTTPEMKEKIRRLAAEEGLNSRALAERFGLCMDTIKDILREAR